MAKDTEIVANDLIIYFNGLKAALEKKDVDEAIRYINTIKQELDVTLDHLNSLKNQQK